MLYKNWIVAALLLVNLNLPVLTPPDPLTCVGYPQPRLFLESQEWWRQTPGGTGTDNGHLHVATCFPYEQTVSGTVHLDVRIIMHENPGTVVRLTIGAYEGDTNNATEVFDQVLNLTCPVTDTCTFWVGADLNTALLPTDGRHVWSIRPFEMDPDGTTARTGQKWPMTTINGKPILNSSLAPKGRGWYSTASYIDAQLDSPAIPYTPISGIFTFRISTLVMGPGSQPVTMTRVHVDPDFHMGNNGAIIYEFSGPVTNQLVTLDTRTLSNGPHRLVIKADSTRSEGSTFSGLFVIPIVVNN